MEELFDISENQDIILYNLKQNNKQIINALKKRLLYTRDLAKLIIGGEENTPIGLISENTAEKFNLLREQAGLVNENAKDGSLFYRGVFELLDTENAALLCRHMAKELDNADLLAPKKPATSRVCYFRNRFSDLAYLAFSKYLPEATADYTHDYESACEGVYNGKYDYCILPLSSYSDSVMTRFIDFTEKYELNISLSCRIPIQDEDFMFFCLLSGENARFEGANRLALTVIPGSSCPLWKFLCAAELLGAKCTECTSLPVRMYSEKSYFTLFELDNCDVGAFLLYLQLALPAYILDGIYKEI